ncbi:hypothetical protein PHYPSEUDO_011257 [Phytophthora pseudosyringae]|uniref:CFA20 domain-containing protein n=1 Tax=Phytophthora pseudosyringae TaxID=221518 RepID=A0A8T1WGI7_9STRA|nr:hypothetical protein PHYPSEUDO_011257 [Phytophthora pseudosyringae]
MAYFQGGDFVELLSAQGKSPAAAWKLQGKISKTFDKGIKGNAFTLDGSSETKLQLPKTASASLGLAQRFVVLQLLVPFTRSFSVEICFSDFHKVRRRFVAASAFRDTARTALHVQLPLSAADVPRDQWMSLVFDLQTLSDAHFPDTGFRSMESVCVSGSCRLKRIFTMKDAPTPSRTSHVVKHADTRGIPRQFVFSATQRGASGAAPIPTLYYATEPVGIVGVHGVAVTANSGAVNNGAPRSGRRSQTAPTKAQAKPAAKAARPPSGLLQRKTPVHPPPATLLETDVDEARDPPRQRLRTPARVSTTGSKLRQPPSKPVVVKQESVSQLAELPPPRDHARGRLFEEERSLDMPADDCLLPRSVQVDKSYEGKTEEEQSMAATPPGPTWMEVRPLDRAVSPPGSAHSSVMVSPNAKDLHPGVQRQTLRHAIMGEIQQKIASLEADDERADQRDRELFVRHTSLHSGEWHLQQLCDDDDALLSDEDDDMKQSRSPGDDTLVKASMASRYGANKEDSIFSFSSVLEPRAAPARQSGSRLFEFESLLQDVAPLPPPVDKEQGSSRTETDRTQLETRLESALADAGDAADDLELTKLLAAKRSARLKTNEDELEEKDGVGEVTGDVQVLRLSRDADNTADTANDRDDWVVVEKHDTTTTSATRGDQTRPDEESSANEQAKQDADSDLDLEGDVNGLSIDLTSELSASGGYENAISRMDPASPLTDESGPEIDHDSSNSLDDDGSSFDFEDLVEDADSGRDEDEEKHAQSTVAVTSDNSFSQQKASRLSRNLDPGLLSSGHQHGHEKRRAPLVPPRRMAPVNSPLMNCPRDQFSQRKSREQPPAKPSQSIALSSSFSSRRLQSLLESTDWTAELNAQANTLRSSSPHSPISARSRDFRSPASSTDVRRSSSKACARRSSQRTPPRPQTPSASSIELMYDPILRCYYDPVANKYYALAE